MPPCSQWAIAPATLKVTRHVITKYCIPFFQDKDLRDIQKGHINGFYIWLPAKLKPITQKNALRVLSRLLNYAESRGGEIKSVPKFPKIRLEHNHAGWIDRKTQELILQHISPEYHKSIFEFMINTAGREKHGPCM